MHRYDFCEEKGMLIRGIKVVRYDKLTCTVLDIELILNGSII